MTSMTKSLHGRPNGRPRGSRREPLCRPAASTLGLRTGFAPRHSHSTIVWGLTRFRRRPGTRRSSRSPRCRRRTQRWRSRPNPAAYDWSRQIRSGPHAETTAPSARQQWPRPTA
jgi:hypothetical protein